MSEARTLKFSADFFNLWNHRVFDRPSITDIENPSFGQITNTVRTPRLVQLLCVTHFEDCHRKCFSGLVVYRGRPVPGAVRFWCPAGLGGAGSLSEGDGPIRSRRSRSRQADARPRQGQGGGRYQEREDRGSPPSA